MVIVDFVLQVIYFIFTLFICFIEHQQPTIHAENKVQTALVGSSVQLRCRSSDSSGRTQIRWTRDRQALPPNALVRGEVLHLVDIRLTDAGRYICEISNEQGQSRDFIDLHVNRK